VVGVNMNYIHDQDNKRTYAIKDLTLAQVIEVIEKDQKLTLEIGTARLAPGDQYIKKVGREVAERTFVSREFTLERFNLIGDRISVILSSDSVVLRGYAIPGKKNVYFYRISINE
jgi:hypothetical protein